MIAILGSGSCATALVKILLEKPDRHLNWWVRRPSLAQAIISTRHNPDHLPNAELDVDRLHISSSLAQVVEQSDLLIVAHPTAYCDEMLRMVAPDVWQHHTIVSATKGFLPSTDETLTETLRCHYNLKGRQLAFIGGPAHAEEIVVGGDTFLTVAAPHRPLGVHVAQLLQAPYLHTVVTTNLPAVELAASMKNIYALAAGVCHGLGCGDNLVAVLVTRSLHEMTQYISYRYPGSEWSQYADASLGDLLATSYSRHSRNRTLGYRVGGGMTVREALDSMTMQAEGYPALGALQRQLWGCPLQLPIAQAVYRIFYCDASPADEIGRLVASL